LGKEKRRGPVFCDGKRLVEARCGPGPKSIPEGGSIVNAAFLLVATAFVTGSDPVQAAPTPVAAPIVSGCSSCDNGCNSCEGKRLFGGFRGLFNRGNDCGCDSCGSKRLFSGLGSGCGCGGGFSLGLKERFASHSSCNTCNECAAEKSCGCGIMESPLSRLGGLFKRRDRGCGCDTCNTCSSCGGGGVIQGAPVTPVPAGAKPAAPTPAAPKPMPAPPAKPVVGQLTPTSNLIIE
jgi:hypothetical protein